MFGFLKSLKDPEKNFQIHISRLKKLFENAYECLDRADSYLYGGGFEEDYLHGKGFGGESTKMIQAQGVIIMAQSKLQEAFYNAIEAIKCTNDNHENVLMLSSVVRAFTTTRGEEFFAHPSIVTLWDNSMMKWQAKFNEVNK